MRAKFTETSLVKSRKAYYNKNKMWKEHTMKKILYFGGAAFLILLAVLCTLKCHVQKEEKPEQIYIHPHNQAGEGSWFRDFVILEDEVAFLCHYEIENETDQTAFVKLIGDFSAEKELSLIEEVKLQGVITDISNFTKIDGAALQDAENTLDENGGKIELKPGKNEFWVLYIGTYAGGSQKANRLLPETEIEICN